LVIRRDVVGAVQISLVDLLTRNERIDLDGVVALDGDGVEFLVIDWDVSAFRILVAAALVRALDRLARDLIDQLLAQPVASGGTIPARSTMSQYRGRWDTRRATA
jgi:hypothetical protein